MNVKEIKMTIKRVQYQDVVVSVENGFDMPKTANELVDTVTSMKNNPQEYLNGESWYCAESTQIVDIDVIEDK